MTQFVHEDDLANAVIAAARGKERGVYNIAGAAVVPWRTAMDICETRATPIPSILIERYVKSFSKFPAYLMRFFKYPCVISDAAFRRDFGWEPQVDIKETLRSAVATARLQDPR
jgi:UDP-glucose 4-epimerase